MGYWVSMWWDFKHMDMRVTLSAVAPESWAVNQPPTVSTMPVSP
jgi:hypothetical protein